MSDYVPLPIKSPPRCTPEALAAKQRVLDSRQEVTERFNNGSRLKDIAGIYGTSSRTLRGILSRWGLSRGHRPYRRATRLGSSEMSVLVGTLLGDANLQVVGNQFPQLKMGHCLAQEEFIWWKYEQLRCLYASSPRLSGDMWWSWSRNCKELVDFYRVFYPQGKKVVTPEILSLVDDLALAVWFMDDGSRHGCGLRLNLGGLTDDEYRLIREWLCDRGFPTTIHRDASCLNYLKLYMNDKTSKVFQDRCGRYFIPCMRYKLAGVKR